MFILSDDVESNTNDVRFIAAKNLRADIENGGMYSTFMELAKDLLRRIETEWDSINEDSKEIIAKTWGKERVE